MTRADVAEQAYRAGYNCAQSVLIAFKDELGLTEQQAARMASGFGGGMGGLREVCGALTGAFLVANLLAGYDDPEDDQAKKAHYAIIKQAGMRFQLAEGSYICRDILEKAGVTPESTPAPRTPEYYASRPCGRCIRLATQIMEEQLQL